MAANTYFAERTKLNYRGCMLRIETNEVKSESSECGVTELRSSDFGGTSSERTSASTIDVAPLCNPVLVFRRSEVRSSGVGPVLTECSCKLASINTRGFRIRAEFNLERGLRIRVVNDNIRTEVHGGEHRSLYTTKEWMKLNYGGCNGTRLGVRRIREQGSRSYGQGTYLRYGGRRNRGQGALSRLSTE